MPNRLYVYALADAPIGLDDVTGLAGEALHLVAGRAYWLVVGELADRPAATRESLEAQDAVVRALAAKADALLPMRFGTSFENETALTQSLERFDATRMRAALSRVRGCEQMALRLFRSIHAATAPSSAPSEPQRPGTAYLRSRVAAVQSPSLDVQALHQQLSEIIRDEIVEPEPARRAPLLATMYHLIARGDADRYIAIASAWPPPDDLAVRISGPAPAYAFAKDALS